jgi:ADP-heptose:LPS heptosyltransferase
MGQGLRILIIKPSSLGDVIHGLQVAATIKHCLDNVSIDWVVRDNFADIVEATGIVDTIFPFHRGGGLGKFVALILQIRNFHYDYVLDMQGLARSGVVAYFARGNKKIGRSDAREFSWLAYDERVPLPPHRPAHAVDILLQFLPKFGLAAVAQAKLTFHGDPSDCLRNLLPVANAENRQMVVLFPESRRKEKEWPYFADLALALAHKFPDFSIVISAQRYFEITRPPKNIHNLSQKTSALDVALLIQSASIVVANDSAPSHIAAALGIPVLALFGPTDPIKFGPYPANNGKNNVLVATDKNLASIPVEKVIPAITSALNHGHLGGVWI